MVRVVHWTLVSTTTRVHAQNGVAVTLCGRSRALGQFPVTSREVAGIAVRVAFEIVLMLGLGFPEFAGGRHARRNTAWQQARGVDIIYGL